MQSIEISTTQNVVIQYELASLLDRFLAYLVDAVIIFGSIFIIGIFTAPFMGEAYQYVLYFVIIPIIFFYTLLLEILNDGQSLGKKAMRIRVVKITGKEANLSDYMLRGVFRTIDIYLSFGAIAAMFISSSGKNQRLGDLLANTTVIKIRPSMALKLEDILSINSRDTYEPKYPEVRKLKEEEMILVKNVLERIRKYPNPIHELALEETVENIKVRLGLSQIKENQIDFLKTLIKDYIVLTR